MRTTLVELCDFLDETLEPERYQDYCPNGLQVEGAARIERLVTGVTACQALIEAAVAWQADAILVHHGYFWRGEPEPVVGMKKARLAALLSANISLLAYHLPLDGHPEHGNNARFGELMGVPQALHEPLTGADVGSIASLPSPVRSDELVSRIAKCTGRAPLLIGDDGVEVERIAWCTGAAQSYIEMARAAGAQMFITGEVSEQTVHIARETGIQFIAAGHHATERYGVQAIGELAARELHIAHRFIDIDNPV